MPIHLTIPVYIRLISWAAYSLGYVLCYLIFPPESLFLGISLWTWMVLRGLFYSPEMTIHPEGIETQRLFWRHFCRWDEISAIRFGEWNSQIYPKGINPLVRSLLYNSLMINAWRGNYKEAVEVMKTHFEASRQTKTQRVYE